jgi:predicted nuclease of predicted toxin-antitoxin system
VKFKVDENLPTEFAPLLREYGFEADTVEDEHLNGSNDSILAERSRAEGRVFVTLDLDFANIRSYPPGDYPGIVVLRSKSQDKVTLISVMRRLIPVLLKTSPNRQLWIVEHDRIRYHGDD